MNVSSRDAAALYGCTVGHLLTAMKEAGVEPECRAVPNKHGGANRHYFWNPSDVMRVRAERRVRRLEAERRFANIRQPSDPKDKARRVTLMRQTAAENFRKKVLQRIADRQLSVR
jgi:hypothetical protein